MGGTFIASSFVIGRCAVIKNTSIYDISITFKSIKRGEGPPVFLATRADNKKSGINCVFCDRQTVAERRSAPQWRRCAALMGPLPKISSNWTPLGSRWSPGGLQVVSRSSIYPFQKQILRLYFQWPKIQEGKEHPNYPSWTPEASINTFGFRSEPGRLHGSVEVSG